MAEYVCKYGEKRGTKFIYKESLTWAEFASITKSAKLLLNDTMAANEALVKLAVEKIILGNGEEHTEKLEIVHLLGACDTRDATRLLKALSKLVSEDDDPKESEST